MMIKRTSGVLVVALFAGSLLGWGQTDSVVEEMEFVSQVRQARLSSVGAASETVERIWNRINQTYRGKTIIFERAVVQRFNRLSDYGYPLTEFNDKAVVIFNTDHQDIKFQISAVMRMNGIDKLRIGQTCRLMLKLENAPEQGTNARNLEDPGYAEPWVEVWGVTVDVRPQTTVMRCKNGHEYAPAAGFKFCPQCGQPLE